MSYNRLAEEAAYFGALQDGVDSRQEEIDSLRKYIKELEHYIFNDVRDMKIELIELKKKDVKV